MYYITCRDRLYQTLNNATLINNQANSIITCVHFSGIVYAFFQTLVFLLKSLSLELYFKFKFLFFPLLNFFNLLFVLWGFVTSFFLLSFYCNAIPLSLCKCTWTEVTSSKLSCQCQLQIYGCWVNECSHRQTSLSLSLSLTLSFSPPLKNKWIHTAHGEQSILVFQSPVSSREWRTMIWIWFTMVSCFLS